MWIDDYKYIKSFVLDSNNYLTSFKIVYKCYQQSVYI